MNNYGNYPNKIIRNALTQRVYTLWRVCTDDGSQNNEGERQMKYTPKPFKAALWIQSGEGESSKAVIYTGKMDMRSIRSRLTRERCNGERWAYACIYSNFSHVQLTDEQLEYFVSVDGYIF